MSAETMSTETMLDIETVIPLCISNANKHHKITLHEGRSPHHHVRLLPCLARALHASTYVEIGTHNGTSMSYVLQCPTLERCIGVDPLERCSERNGPGTGRYAQLESINIARTTDNISRNNPHGTSYVIHPVFSDELQDIPENIDVLFVDGDHSESGTQYDVTRYGKNVRPNGVIVLDDLNYAGIRKVFRRESRKPHIRKAIIVYRNGETLTLDPANAVPHFGILQVG